jgi:site-specific recombinase XerD
VFFTRRALSWLSLYLQARTDNQTAVFTTRTGTARLGMADIWRPFARYRKLAGIAKPVTPHVLRHYAGFRTIPGEVSFAPAGSGLA